MTATSTGPALGVFVQSAFLVCFSVKQSNVLKKISIEPERGGGSSTFSAGFVPRPYKRLFNQRVRQSVGRRSQQKQLSIPVDFQDLAQTLLCGCQAFLGSLPCKYKSMLLDLNHPNAQKQECEDANQYGRWENPYPELLGLMER